MSGAVWEAWWQLGARATLGAGALTLVALAAVALAAGRWSAGRRHLVLAGALAGSLALPLVASFAPRWGSVPAWPAAEVADAGARRLAERGVAKGGAGGGAVVGRDSQAVGQAGPGPGWKASLFLAWSAGVLVLAVRGLRSRRRLRRWAGKAGPGDRAGLGTSLDACAEELGLRRDVELLLADGSAAGPAAPLTWGLVRPRLLLPAGAQAWSPLRQRVVLLHELAHVRRGDAWGRLLAEVAGAVFWFHPLVRLAARRLSAEAERACDDLVLLQGVPPSRYLEELVEVVREMRSGERRQPAMALGSSGLAERARAIAATDLRRRPPSPAEGGAAWLGGVLLALCVAGFGGGRPQAAAEGERGPPPGASPAGVPAAAFSALSRDAERGAFLGDRLASGPEAVAAVLVLAPAVGDDAVLQELLLRVLRDGLDPALVGPFLSAARALDADAARQAVLVELVASHRLQPPSLLATIRAAREMRAVAARADSLVAIARSHPLFPAAVRALREAAGELERPSARRAVLGALST